MVNLHRGEIEAVLDGRPFRLCLTLGALAELEAAFGDEDMLALATRFEGWISARDCVRIIGAGLRGAGHEIANDAVARMASEGGAAGYVEIVARLLNATFAGQPRHRERRKRRVTAALSLGRRDGGGPWRAGAGSACFLGHDATRVRRSLAGAARRRGSTSAPTRSDLLAMMQQFPDEARVA